MPKVNEISHILDQIADSVKTGIFMPVETHHVELKNVPATGHQWKEIQKSANAFLNTSGGVLILGIREDNTPKGKKHCITGYHEDAEPKLKELAQIFADKQGRKLNLAKYFPEPQIVDFLGARIALVFVDPLPADEKFCYLDSEAYKRLLTGDEKLKPAEIGAQEEYKQEAFIKRELRPVDGTSIEDISLERLNEYIQRLNDGRSITTLKPDLESARAFLESQQMLKDGQATLIGMLICGREPSRKLGFRCRLQAYLDQPGAVTGDKLVLDDNIVPLMEQAYSFIVRNTRRTIIVEQGGQLVQEYPPELLRESVNNAFAHRDYSIDQYNTVNIKPGESLEIRNPGTFRQHLLIQHPQDETPVLRIVPEARARNPKLAHALNFFSKWEGRGTGMSTLVSHCLEDRTDIPFFRFRTEEVSLFLQPGRLLDERMKRLFAGHDRFLRDAMRGIAPTMEQLRLLAYIVKSEERNRNLDFTILLTQDNNHFAELNALREARLIELHPKSTALHPVYVAARVLTHPDHLDILRERFGSDFDSLDALKKDVLITIRRYNEYSTEQYPSARVVALTLWSQMSKKNDDIRGFDTFNRSVRKAANDLEALGLLHVQKSKGLSRNYIVPEKKLPHQKSRTTPKSKSAQGELF